MKNYYFAAFIPVQEGGYEVYFPDFTNAFTEGATLPEAFTMAEDVLNEVLRDLVFRNQAVPEPCTDVQAVKHKVEQNIKEMDTNIAGEVLYQMVPAPFLDALPVKISVSIAKGVLDEAERKAKLCGLTRSGLIAKAVQEYAPA